MRHKQSYSRNYWSWLVAILGSETLTGKEAICTRFIKIYDPNKYMFRGNIVNLWQIEAELLQWRHNWRNGVSSLHCLLNCLFRRRSKKTSKLRVTDLCGGNYLVTGDFPAQKASKSKNVQIW